MTLVRYSPDTIPSRWAMPVSVKDTVRALLERLPEDCTLDDVVYHLYVIQSVERGMQDAAEGRTSPQEKVAADLRRKRLNGASQ